jgi:hypothetical protein
MPLAEAGKQMQDRRKRRSYDTASTGCGKRGTGVKPGIQLSRLLPQAAGRNSGRGTKTGGAETYRSGLTSQKEAGSLEIPGIS